jgi:hypothetical protein
MFQEYIKGLNEYVRLYRRKRTYEFWTWYLEYLLFKFGVEKDAFLTRTGRKQEVCVSCYVDYV